MRSVCQISPALSLADLGGACALVYTCFCLVCLVLWNSQEFTASHVTCSSVESNGHRHKRAVAGSTKNAQCLRVSSSSSGSTIFHGCSCSAVLDLHHCKTTDLPQAAPAHMVASDSKGVARTHKQAALLCQLRIVLTGLTCTPRFRHGCPAVGMLVFTLPQDHPCLRRLNSGSPVSGLDPASGHTSRPA